MKKLMKKLEDIMVAVTFAESGEYDEASRQAGDNTLPHGLEDKGRQLQEFKKTALESTGK